MLKYTLALFLFGCAPSVDGFPVSLPQAPSIRVQTRKTIPVVVNSNYDAMPRLLSADKRLAFNSAKGTWSSLASFDFVRGRHVLYDLVYALPVREPKAIENRLYELDFGGSAWLNLDAKTPCNGGTGDTVSDGNGGTACVTPWLSFEITDAAGAVLFDRTGPDPVPPPIWAQPLPRGTFVPVAYGASSLQLRLHVRGTMTFTVDQIQAWIAEKTWDFVCDGSAC